MTLKAKKGQQAMRPLVQEQEQILQLQQQNLEIQVCEKKIREHGFEITSKTDVYEQALANIQARKADLELWKSELETITAETEKEEQALLKKAEKAQSAIEERLLFAYNRLRGNAVNGLAVVTITRDSCSGCFNQIPPQRQLDVRQRKKIIVCEHCGRILVDEALTQELAEA